ncbi:MAG: hypothetical protein ACR2KT_18195 [Methylocella sp.]
MRTDDLPSLAASQLHAYLAVIILKTYHRFRAMWSSTVWGFVNLAVSTSDPSWKAWFSYAAIFAAFCFCGWHAFRHIKKHLSGTPSTLDVTVSYDMPIAKAIDYILNDSTQKLKRSSLPRIADFGPAKGHQLIERGAEHSDAFRLVAEKAILGDIRASRKIPLPRGQQIRFKESL